MCQESGVGRFVNVFKKKEGLIGDEAKRLVTTWKLLVQKEQEANRLSSKHSKSTSQTPTKKKSSSQHISPSKIKQEPVDSEVVRNIKQEPNPDNYEYQRKDSFTMLTDHLSNLKNDLMNDIRRETQDIDEVPHIKQEKYVFIYSQRFTDSVQLIVEFQIIHIIILVIFNYNFLPPGKGWR